METISKDISDYVEKRVAAALCARDEQLKQLEQDKRVLLRKASELKNEVKNMRVTVAMFEKQMSNPSRNVKTVEHKCVGCDLRVNGPKPKQSPKSELESLLAPSASTTPGPSTSRQDKISLGKPSNETSVNGGDTKLNGKLDKWLKRENKAIGSPQEEEEPKKAITGPTITDTFQLNTESAAPHLESLLIAPLPSSILKPASPFSKRQKSNIEGLKQEVTTGDESSTMLKSSTDITYKTEDSADVEIIDLSDGEDRPVSSSLSSSPSNLKTPQPPTIKVQNIRLSSKGEYEAVFKIFANLSNTAPDVADIQRYELFMHCKSQTYGIDRNLTKIGEMKLENNKDHTPILFTTSQLTGEFSYSFMVKAIDKFNRSSEFSQECQLDL